MFFFLNTAVGKFYATCTVAGYSCFFFVCDLVIKNNRNLELNVNQQQQAGNLLEQNDFLNRNNRLNKSRVPIE